MHLVGYSNADFGGDGDKENSTTKTLFLFVGGVIRWSNNKQTPTLHSAVEAEFIAHLYSTRKAVWPFKLSRESQLMK